MCGVELLCDAVWWCYTCSNVCVCGSGMRALMFVFLMSCYACNDVCVCDVVVLQMGEPALRNVAHGTIVQLERKVGPS